MPPRVAAITMAYNEAVFLPIWASHYARQVGADHCYVVDHGSSEPLVLPPGVNVLRLPRSPHDDAKRATFISDLARSLLSYYDWVSYTDCDELLLADPARFANLPAFCQESSLGTVHAVGLDIQHVPGLEPAFDPRRRVGQQRRWARFTSAMCKPALTRQVVRWPAGFHSSDRPLAFAPLFLFHLHWADRQAGMDRLAKTRSMAWGGDPSAGSHQRLGDDAWLCLFDGMATLPRVETVVFDIAADPIREWLTATVRSSIAASPPYSFDLHVNAAELWAIPEHFRARL